MNVTKYQLPTLICNQSESVSILEIVIHTILFQRTLGIEVTPKDTESYLFDNLSYVAIDDDRIINKVKHDLICIYQEKEGNTLPVIISLYYAIKKYGILGEYYEKIEFERWSITLEYMLDKTFVDENTLENKILEMITMIASVSELPIQLPNHEKFSFTITSSTPKQNGIVYDMFASASRMFGTP
jgi:hypothetical protein